MCVSCNVITCIGNEMLLQSAKKIFRLSNLAFNPPQFKFNILRAPLLRETQSLKSWSL